MKTENHIEAYNEHRDAINWAIDRGIEKSQRTIGIHTSRAIVELLSAFLHRINAIEMGFQINHRWFKTEKVFERFPDFPEKNLIFKKIVQLEPQSENLTYGAQKTKEEIKSVLALFNETEKIILNAMEDHNEKQKK